MSPHLSLKGFWGSGNLGDSLFKFQLNSDRFLILELRLPSITYKRSSKSSKIKILN